MIRREQDAEARREHNPAHDLSVDAVKHLFAKHNAALIRFLKLRLHSDQDARDVAQEAYVRLLSLEDTVTVSFLRAYLFRIASNLATDRLRRNAVRHAAHIDLIFDPPDIPSPERSASARQQLGIIEAALLELPETIRRAFIFRRVDGVAIPVIARRIGVSERCARYYVAQAMVHCRKALDEAEQPREGRE